VDAFKSVCPKLFLTWC